MLLILILSAILILTEYIYNVELLLLEIDFNIYILLRCLGHNSK